jgi:hypothetical protein
MFSRNPNKNPSIEFPLKYGEIKPILTLSFKLSENIFSLTWYVGTLFSNSLKRFIASFCLNLSKYNEVNINPDQASKFFGSFLTIIFANS